MDVHPPENVSIGIDPYPYRYTVYTLQAGCFMVFLRGKMMTHHCFVICPYLSTQPYVVAWVTIPMPEGIILGDRIPSTSPPVKTARHDLVAGGTL